MAEVDNNARKAQLERTECFIRVALGCFDSDNGAIANDVGTRDIVTTLDEAIEAIRSLDDLPGTAYDVAGTVVLVRHLLDDNIASIPDQTIVVSPLRSALTLAADSLMEVIEDLSAIDRVSHEHA